MADRKFWILVTVLTTSQVFSLGVGLKGFLPPSSSIKPTAQKEISFHVSPPSLKIFGTVLEEHLEKSGESFLPYRESIPIEHPVEKLPCPDRNPDHNQLLTMTAPWAYVGFRSINELREGKFCRLKTKEETRWIPEYGFLGECVVISLSPDRAVLKLNDSSTQLERVNLVDSGRQDPFLSPPEQITHERRKYRDLYLRRMQALSSKHVRLLKDHPSS